MNNDNPLINLNKQNRDIIFRIAEILNGMKYMQSYHIEIDFDLDSAPTIKYEANELVL